MKRIHLKKLLSMLCMSVMLVSMLAGCGDEDKDVNDTSTTTTTSSSASTSTSTDDNNSSVSLEPGYADPTDDSIQYGLYLGYWTNEGEDVTYSFYDDATWVMYRTSTGEFSCTGTVEWWPDHINLIDESGEHIYAEITYYGETISDNYGYAYVRDYDYSVGSADDAAPFIFEGWWYLDGDLSADSYILIEQGSFNLFYREPGYEPTLIDYGYYTPIDEAGNFIAYSETMEGVTYTIFAFDTWVFYFNDVRYELCEE